DPSERAPVGGSIAEGRGRGEGAPDDDARPHSRRAEAGWGLTPMTVRHHGHTVGTARKREP
ncbi:hypothetical protein ACC691_38745, partial [Rhizobium johnstonii]|uniref:hypothetical protein n=1 Tax=Rhizobium johnstonii TaxID=3019933 RepID=UPI003F980877